MRIGPSDLMDPLQRIMQNPEFQRLSFADRQAVIDEARSRLARNMVSGGPAEIPSVLPSAAPTIAAPNIVGGPATYKNRKPLSAAEKATLDSIKNIKGQLLDIRAKMQKYGQKNWDSPEATGRWKTYLLRKYAAVSSEPYTPDQGAIDRDSLNSALINVEANAKAALAHTAGTKAYSYVQDSAGHIPRAPGDFKFNMDNIDYLLSENGPYNGYIRSVGLDPHAGEPTVGAGKMPEATPTPADAEAASKKYGGM